MFMFIPDLHMAYPIDWFAKITRRQWVKCDVHPYLQVTPWYLMKRGYSGHQYMGYCGCSNVINHTIFSCLESHPFMYGDDWGMVYEIAIPNWSKLNIFWLVVSTPLKNMKVSWDDDIPNIWKNKSHVPNHQSVSYSKPFKSYLCTCSAYASANDGDITSSHHQPVNILLGKLFFTDANSSAIYSGMIPLPFAIIDLGRYGRESRRPQVGMIYWPRNIGNIEGVP